LDGIGKMRTEIGLRAWAAYQILPTAWWVSFGQLAIPSLYKSNDLSTACTMRILFEDDKQRQRSIVQDTRCMRALPP
jgi:hypothetical protein